MFWKKAPQGGAEVRILREPSGTLSAGETITGLDGMEWARLAIVRVDITLITTPDADDQVDFYIQTSYNEGVDWVDLENIHLIDGDNGNTEVDLVVIGGPKANNTYIAETDGTLSDNTKVDLPLGDRLRIKTLVTGASAPSYAYNAEVYLIGG